MNQEDFSRLKAQIDELEEARKQQLARSAEQERRSLVIEELLNHPLSAQGRRDATQLIARELVHQDVEITGPRGESVSTFVKKFIDARPRYLAENSTQNSEAPAAANSGSPNRFDLDQIGANTPKDQLDEYARQIGDVLLASQGKGRPERRRW